jgi:hypothetical protein
MCRSIKLTDTGLPRLGPIFATTSNDPQSWSRRDPSALSGARKRAECIARLKRCAEAPDPIDGTAFTQTTGVSFAKS